MHKADISFGTFNLYNLQLPGKRWREGSKPYTTEQYAAKLEWSARALRALSADVIAFQELWAARCLQELFDAAELSDQYHLHFIDPSWYDIAVAVAVRKPWHAVETKVHKSFPGACVLKKRRAPVTAQDREDDEVHVKIDRFSRSVLQVRVEKPELGAVPGIEVFITHLKSKLPTRLDKVDLEDQRVKSNAVALGDAISTIRRTAEAAALRVLLTEVMKGTNTPVVALGDFNDGLLSNTLNILSQQPPLRLKSKSRVGLSNDGGLYSTAMLQQLNSLRDIYYSHEHHGVLELLDHVLVSEQFYDHSKNRIWTLAQMRVWNDHVPDSDPTTTDHGIVGAYFDFNPAKKK